MKLPNQLLTGLVSLALIAVLTACQAIPPSAVLTSTTSATPVNQVTLPKINTPQISVVPASDTPRPEVTLADTPTRFPTQAEQVIATATPRPPGVEITSPAYFLPLRARTRIYLAVNAYSPAGIRQVGLYINDQPIATRDARGALEINAVFDWSTENNGDYQIQAKATDTSGQVMSSGVAVQQVRGGVDPIVNGTTTVSEIGSTVSIPEGTFIMGDDTGPDDERPQHAVSLSAYEIDRFEVTVQQYKAFIKNTQYQTAAEKDGKPITRTWQIDNTPDRWEHPVRYVSWWDADAYCRTSGKRLPTEAEWEYAARGIDQRRYPWGNEYDANRLNSGDTAPVGFFSNGVSPFGLYDMAGNVWEWTEDWYDPGAYATSGARDPRAAKASDQKAIRGGGFNSSADDVRVTRRIYNFPTTYHQDVGFRCVKGPE